MAAFSQVQNRGLAGSRYMFADHSVETQTHSVMLLWQPAQELILQIEHAVHTSKAQLSSYTKVSKPTALLCCKCFLGTLPSSGLSIMQLLGLTSKHCRSLVTVWHVVQRCRAGRFCRQRCSGIQFHCLFQILGMLASTWSCATRSLLSSPTGQRPLLQPAVGIIESLA